MFTFKGISTKDMNIIVEEAENLIAKAPQKHEVVSILGRSDSSYYPMGYDPVKISLSLQLLDPSKVDEVLAWLDGQGELIYKDRKTQARIFSEVKPVRTSGIRLINIEIIRSPFWYKLEDDYENAWGANLIPDGWDSFEPYVFGEPIGKAPSGVFDEGYAQNEIINGDFRVNELNNFYAPNPYGVLTVLNNMLEIEIREDSPGLPALMRTNKKFNKDDVYYIKIKVNPFKTHDLMLYDGRQSFSPGKVEAGKFNEVSIVLKYGTDSALSIYANGEDKEGSMKGDKTIFDYVYITNLTETFGAGKEPTKEWCDENMKYQPNWEDLLDEEKPVDAYEEGYVYIQPLGNGLTRIQTWGGNHRVKIAVGTPLTAKIGDKQTRSLYVENNSDNFVRFDQDGGTFDGNPKSDWSHGEKGVKKYTGVFSKNVTGVSVYIRASTPDENLDFIASDPQIVEGDKTPSWSGDSNPRIINEGTVESQPLIKLTKGKESVCEFEVNNVYFKYHFNNDDHVIIDCEEMEATYNTLPRNRHLTIGFEFPKLKPNDNVVKTVSGDATISFKRKDRWL